jgi:hypothetical protein
VCWDPNDIGVDAPALYDPHTKETVNGRVIVAYLLKTLDTEGKRIYQEGTLEAEKVQIRIERMLERVQAGDPIRFAFGLDGYLREVEGVFSTEPRHGTAPGRATPGRSTPWHPSVGTRGISLSTI